MDILIAQFSLNRVFSLITGPPGGELNFVFKKFLELNEKNGPFSAAFIIGGIPTTEADLSALFDIIKTEYSSKFPIYFVASRVKNGLLEDTLIEELAQRNVHFMRPFGVSKTPEGLRFAYISGTERSDDEIQFGVEDLKYVEEQFMISSERDEDEGLLDVLFIWSWPREIKTNSSFRGVPESQRLGPLIWNLKPRYIFSASHDSIQHFERAPYENVDNKTGEFLHPSRFIALARAEGISESASNIKKKWIYALNLVPGKFVTPFSLTKRPEDCTSNPFLPILTKSDENSVAATPNYFFQGELGSKRKFETENSAQIKKPPTGYICKKCHSSDHFYRDCIYKDSTLQPDTESTYVCHICHEPGHHIRNCPKKNEKQEKQPLKSTKTVAPETCWFCLSNPAARKHLIVEIGEEVYLTLAKGPLTPEHLILVTIEHVSSTLIDLSEALDEELNRLILRVNNLNEGKKAIFFRMSCNPSHHLHMQSISIESLKFPEFLEFLEDFSIKLGYKFKETETRSKETIGAFFEFAYVSESGDVVRLVHEYDPSAFFPAQYGRQVLARFLEIEGGADWKNQIYTEEEEKCFVSDLKKKLSNKN